MVYLAKKNEVQLFELSRYARKTEYIPTGLFTLDYLLLENGGLPRGRVIEIFGPPSGGKSYLCLKAVGQAQKLGLKTVWFDVERVMDEKGRVWAEVQGVDTDRLIIPGMEGPKGALPLYWAEDVLDCVKTLAEAGEYGLIVIDSVAGLIPKSYDSDKGYGEKGGMTGDLAKIMSQALKEINAAAFTGNCCVVFVNQLRTKPGVMYGEVFTTTGGDALKFYSSLRVDVKKRKDIEENGILIGNSARVTIKKSKVSTPYISTGENNIPDILVYYDGRDPNNTLDIIEIAINRGFVAANGPFYSYGEYKAKGKEAFVGGLTEEVFSEIKSKITQANRKG